MEQLSPITPKQWWRREGARNVPFWHHWNGGRGGPDGPFILSKIVVFSVTPFKIGQNKNHNRWMKSESGKRKRVNMQRLSPTFRSQQWARYAEICFTRIYRFKWRRHVCAPVTETSVTKFCYKSVNSSLDELKNIKIISFLIHEQYVNAASRKS